MRMGTYLQAKDYLLENVFKEASYKERSSVEERGRI